LLGAIDRLKDEVAKRRVRMTYSGSAGLVEYARDNSTKGGRRAGVGAKDRNETVFPAFSLKIASNRLTAFGPLVYE